MLTLQITSIPWNPPHLPYCFCILHHRLQNHPSMFSLNEMPTIYFSFKVTRTPRAIHGLRVCVCVYTCVCACVYVRVAPQPHARSSWITPSLLLLSNRGLSFSHFHPPLPPLLPQVPQDRALLLRHPPHPSSDASQAPRPADCTCEAPPGLPLLVFVGLAPLGPAGCTPSSMLWIIRQKSLKMVTSWIALLS